MQRRAEVRETPPGKDVRRADLEALVQANRLASNRDPNASSLAGVEMKCGYGSVAIDA